MRESREELTQNDISGFIFLPFSMQATVPFDLASGGFQMPPTAGPDCRLLSMMRSAENHEPRPTRITYETVTKTSSQQVQFQNIVDQSLAAFRRPVRPLQPGTPDPRLAEVAPAVQAAPLSLGPRSARFLNGFRPPDPAPRTKDLPADQSIQPIRLRSITPQSAEICASSSFRQGM